MTSRNVLLSCAALCLGALSAITLSACTDAGLCERGELGCACTESGTCFDGMTCGSGSLCEEDPSAGSGGSGGSGGAGSGGTGGAGSGGSGGTSGRVTPELKDPGPPPDETCDSTDTEALCASFCEAHCQNQERFCIESSCEPGDCDAGGELFETCVDECGGSDTCAATLCESQIEDDLTCQTFSIESDGVFESLCFGDDPACVVEAEVGCTVTCGTLDGVGRDLVDNGVCEDGHPDDAIDEVSCPRGTDCGDCPPHPCSPIGERCANPGDCCGFFDDTGALCVNIGTPTCLQTCEDESDCGGGTGFSCVPTDSQGSDSVCVPL